MNEMQMKTASELQEFAGIDLSNLSPADQEALLEQLEPKKRLRKALDFRGVPDALRPYRGLLAAAHKAVQPRADYPIPAEQL
jgi:hypothetical protein